ncbi:ankyrin repeat domain-containing protein [Candidatus Odyssella thessalonicensis]|uniref:ankyrin repeat domain-containing protein n=1 Tax=Candidatus Odyssella thessalonicensis TaxID=84647 RepID=UPI0004969022|nr:ankyrin repeat domain-containing protein [Candidatus Odyssella thessalonicensis]
MKVNSFKLLFLVSILKTNLMYAMEQPVESMSSSSGNSQAVVLRSKRLGRHNSFKNVSQEYPFLGTYTDRNKKTEQIVDFELLLSLPEIHSKATGKGVSVGILESGIDWNHDLFGADGAKLNFLKVGKDFSHGTAVTSVIHAVAPASELRFQDRRLSLSGQYEILNVSSGFLASKSKQKDSDWDTYHMAYDSYAQEVKKLALKGILIVKSAGNRGTEVSLGLQRFIEEETQGRMIAIGNLDYSQGYEQLASSSNYSLPSFDRFICTPGSQILVGIPGSRREAHTGTSFSAPIVSGALALLMEAFPAWRYTPEKYIDILLRSARKNDKLGFKIGRGVLDIKAAFKEAEIEQFLESINNYLRQNKNFRQQELDDLKARSLQDNKIDLRVAENLFDLENLISLFIIRGYSKSLEKILSFEPAVVNNPVKDLRQNSLLNSLEASFLLSPLELAIQTGQSTIVELLLAHNANPEISDKGLLFALAKLQKFAPLTKKLFKQSLKQTEFVSETDRYGRTLLMVAVYFGAPWSIVKLLKQKCSSFALDNWGQTAIDWAIMGQYPKIDKLLEYVKPNQTNFTKGGLTYLHLAAATDNAQIIQLLLDKGAAIDAKEMFDLQTPLHIAAIQDARQALQLLLKNGAEIDQRDKDGDTALHILAERNQPASIEMLLDYGAEVNPPNSHEQTPVFNVAVANSLQTLTRLVAKGANIHHRDAKGNTALFRACTENATRVIKRLLDIGANINDENFIKQTPLHMAAGYNAVDAVELLIANGAQVDARDTSGWMPLSIAIMKNAESAVEILLEKTKDVDAKDNYGQTPLMIAAYNNSEFIVKLLLERNARIDAANEDGLTPLLCAVINNNLQIAEMLIAKGADINHQDNYGQTPLFIAAEKDAYQIGELLITRGANVNHRNSNGVAPLMAAAYHDSKFLVELLIKRNAQIDATNEKGFTALFAAAINNNIKSAELLIAGGANINQQDKDGQTPLFKAVENKAYELIVLLVEWGSDINHRDKQGRNIIDIARSLNFDSIAALLERKLMAKEETFSPTSI